MVDPHHSNPAPRTGTEEHDYLRRRAADHARLADRTQDSDARAIHLRMRQLYLTRADRVAMVHQD